jgi:hypothetical protein
VSWRTCPSITDINLDLLSVRVFNCRIIAFYPDILHELRCLGSVSLNLLTLWANQQHTCQTTFSDSTCCATTVSHALVLGRKFVSLPEPRTTMWYSLCDMLQVSQEVVERAAQRTLRISPCLNVARAATEGQAAQSRRSPSSTGS